MSRIYFLDWSFLSSELLVKTLIIFLVLTAVIAIIDKLWVRRK